MKILITEQQLQIIYEQNKYDCFPEFSESIDIAINVYKIPPIFVKYGLAIIGRESDYGVLLGNSISKYLPSQYAIKSVPEYVYNLLSQNEYVKKKLTRIIKSLTNKENWTPSMGIGQMTPDVAKKYKIGVNDLMTKTGALVGTSSYLRDLYKSLVNYDENTPTIINYNGKLIINPNSTGNARMDVAIISYNLGVDKMKSSFCQTNDPNILSPCNLKQYKPYPQKNPEIVLNVFADKIIKNYLPFYSTSTGNGNVISSHGYLKEVKLNSEKFTCF